MDHGKILRRAWHVIWRCRALWFFGALLALTTVNAVYLGGGISWREHPNEITVKVSDDVVLRLPGEGLSLDLTSPRGLSIKVDSNELQRRLEEALDWAYVHVSRDVGVVLGAVTAVVMSVLLLSTILRYAAEAGLIRMVSDYEDCSVQLSVWEGLRVGLSQSACRLFLMDVLIGVPIALVPTLVFALALCPLLMCILGSTAVAKAGSVISLELVYVGIALAIAASVVLSPLKQILHRACVIGRLGVIASIWQGLLIVKEHRKDVGITWLIWIAMRLVWMVTMVPVMIVIFPVTLLFAVLGGVLGGLPALLTWALTTAAYGQTLAWILGAVIGAPIFLLVMSAPMLFLGGLVEVLKSSTWTLTFREILV